jgi:hypothetical protein
VSGCGGILEVWEITTCKVSQIVGMTTTVSVQEITTRLRQPIPSLDELQSLLAAPLSSLGVQSNVATYSKLIAPPNGRQLVTLQATVLGYVFPVWEEQTSLVWHYFCPSNAPRSLVLGAMAVLTVSPLSPSAVTILEKFVTTYPLDRIWGIAYRESGVALDDKTEWNEALKNWVSIPIKVANARAGEVKGVLASGYVPCWRMMEDI